MATVHHPPASGVGFHLHHEWLWIALGAVVIAVMASAITWAVTQPDASVETAVTVDLSGYELDDDTSAMRIATQRVAAFHGLNGEPATGPLITMGFELDDETTSLKVAAPGVTTYYLGINADLDPER